MASYGLPPGKAYATVILDTSAKRDKLVNRPGRESSIVDGGHHSRSHGRVALIYFFLQHSTRRWILSAPDYIIV